MTDRSIVHSLWVLLGVAGVLYLGAVLTSGVILQRPPAHQCSTGTLEFKKP